MKQSLVLRNKYAAIAAVFVLVFSLTMMGCSGGSGASGSASGAPAAATTAGTVSGGTISGTVQSSTGTGLANITVSAYLTTSGTAAGYKQSSPSQNYQNAKALLASSNPVIASTTTGSNGTYSLSLPQGVYAIVFTDPNGNYTLGAFNNEVVANGVTTTLNASMGETSAAAPTVTVASQNTTVASSNSAVNPLGLYSTDEVGYGNQVGLVAQATSPVSVTSAGLAPSFTYKWSAKYSVNPGGTASVTANGNTATVTLPTPAQALAGVQDAAFTVDSQTGMCDSGMYVSTVNPGQTAGCYDVPPYVPSSTIGVLPITADTRGTVSTTVTVTDGLGGSTAVAISSNAAGTQTGLNNVPLGEPVYVNNGKGLYGAASWTLTAPAGSSAKILNSTAAIASFIPDMAGTYVATDTSNTTSTNSLTIYAGTWYGVVTGGGETSATVPASGFTQFTTPGGGTSQVAVGIWATSAGSYSDWPYVTVNPLCQDCHSASPYTTAGNNGFTLTATDKFSPWTGTAHATFMARGMNGITANSGSCLTCHSVGFDQAINAGGQGLNYVAMLDGWAYPATRQAGNWKALLGETQYAKVAQLSNIQCENCHGPQTSSGHESGLVGTTAIPAGTRVSYSAEDCAICHADGSTHHIYSEWLASKNPGQGGSTIQIAATPLSPTYTYQIIAGRSGNGHNNSTIEASTGCNRCHTAEGFKAYMDQVLGPQSPSYTTSPGYLGQQQVPSVAGILVSQYVPNSVQGAANAPVYAFGTTTANLHPQTCTACHDPHNDKNPYQLRVYNSVPITMAGVGVSGLGAGAICTTCHAAGDQDTGGVQQVCTTTSGSVVALNALGACPTGSTATGTGPTFLHEDTDPTNVNPPTVGGYTFPTYPAGMYFDTPAMDTETEVLLGRDAFFMGGSLPMVSPHASVQDSCVGCHMTLNPTMNGTKVATHTWYIQDGQRPALCANCHGGTTGDVSGTGLVTNTLNSQALLSSSLGTGMLQALKNLYPNGGIIYVNGNTASAAVNVSQITAVSTTNIYSGTTQPWTTSPTTVPSGTTFYFYTSSVTNGVAAANYVASGSLKTIYTSTAETTPVFSPNGIFRKAIWNLDLVVDDKSNGVHNPQFVTAVLANTIQALTTLNYIDPRTGKALPY